MNAYKIIMFKTEYFIYLTEKNVVYAIPFKKFIHADLFANTKNFLFNNLSKEIKDYNEQLEEIYKIRVDYFRHS